jgi:hypothetical protein
MLDPMRLLGVACASLLGLASGGAAAAALVARADAGPTCAKTRPSTFLVSPNATRPGGSVSLLLWCHRSSRLGFEGSYGPTGLVIYGESSFDRLRFVDGFPRAGSRPPLQPRYEIEGPDEIRVMLPGSIAAGAYAILLDDGRADVRAQNLLDVK